MCRTGGVCPSAAARICASSLTAQREDKMFGVGNRPLHCHILGIFLPQISVLSVNVWQATRTQAWPLRLGCVTCVLAALPAARLVAAWFLSPHLALQSILTRLPWSGCRLLQVALAVWRAAVVKCQPVVPCCVCPDGGVASPAVPCCLPPRRRRTRTLCARSASRS